MRPNSTITGSTFLREAAMKACSWLNTQNYEDVNEAVTGELKNKRKATPLPAP
jgi:hypothetical protein